MGTLEDIYIVLVGIETTKTYHSSAASLALSLASMSLCSETYSLYLRCVMMGA